MDIATLHVEEHEIAKADDFEFGFLSVIKNTALLERMLVSAETDYVVGGRVNAVPGTMEVTVEALWANGTALENPVFRDEVSLPVTITRPVAFPRMDIIQVRGVLEQYDYQRRAFHNPELEHGQFFMMNTKTRLSVEINVKQGIEGDEHAPAADAGYVKLAEVLTDPEMTSLLPEHLRNVTAIHQGEPNILWTTEQTRTFNLGSLSETRSMFAVEHLVNGKHRPRVIKAENIDIGVGEEQLNAALIPLGQNIETSAIFLEKTISIIEALVRLIHLFEGLGNGGGSGGEGGGGGEFALGLAIHAYKFYSKATIMFTNARIVDRRKKGWDIGLPYLSEESEVYHFDTDTKNQHQEQTITITGPHELMGKDDRANGIFITPAVLESPPHEMRGRSLVGSCSITGFLGGINSSLDFYLRMMNGGGLTLLCIGPDAADSTDPELWTAALNDLELCVSGGGEPELSEARTFHEERDSDTLFITIRTEDPELWAASLSDPGLCVSAGQPELSMPDTLGNRIIHQWPGGGETINLSAEGITFPERIWLHVGIVISPTHISVLIGVQQIALIRRSPKAGDVPFSINPGMKVFNIDELMIDKTARETIGQFSENTADRIPWAALDYRQKWAVIQVHDPDLFKTNIFDGEAFSAAWQREYAKQQSGG